MRRLATALLLVAASSVASAAVIYDGGSPDQGGVYYGDRSFQPFVATDVAVPFQLQPGLNTITDVHWWGGCFFGGGCPDGDFIMSFYSDTAGLPGSLIQSYTLGNNVNQTATGNTIGDCINASCTAEYSYSTIVSPLTLAPLTRFWLGLSNNVNQQGDNVWGLETTSNAGAPALNAQFYSALNPPFSQGWNALPTALAFNLTNDATVAVPEPGTLSLLALALAGLVAGRRRAARAC